MKVGKEGSVRVFKSHLRKIPGRHKKEWSYGVDIRFIDESGQKVRKKLSGFTKKEAEVVAAKARTEMFAGEVSLDERRAYELTWQELHDEWMRYCDASKKNSKRDDDQRLGRAVDYFGPEKPVHSTTKSEVQAFRSWLMNQRRMRPGFAPSGRTTKDSIERAKLSAATVNRYTAVCRSAINHAIRSDLLRDNPFVGLSPIREENKRDRICTPQEYQRLLDGSDSDLRLTIFLAYETGMRRGEIVNLTDALCDFERRMIHLPRELTKSKSSREVPMSRAVVSALKKAGLDDRGRFIHCDPDTLTSGFTRLVRRLKLGDLRLHDLRHTFATRLRRQGVDAITIMRICGWNSREVFDRYNSVNDKDRLAAVDGKSGDIGVLLDKLQLLEEQHQLIASWLTRMRVNRMTQAEFIQSVSDLFVDRNRTLLRALGDK